jgi:hypothetical protein
LLPLRTPPTTNVGKDVGKKEALYISWYKHYGKQYGGSLKI